MGSEEDIEMDGVVWKGRVDKSELISLLDDFADYMDEDAMPERRILNGVKHDLCRGSVYHKFSSWVKLNKYEDWYDDIIENDVACVVRDVIDEHYENSDDFREKIDKNAYVVDAVVGEDIPYREFKRGDKYGKDEEREEEDTMRYGELHDIGVVDENNDVSMPKLRGTMVAFARNVDDIDGKKGEVNAEDVMEEYNRWMLDKFEEAWPRFNTEKLGPSDLSDEVERLLNDNEEFVELVTSAYKPNVRDTKGAKLNRKAKKKSINKWADDDLAGKTDDVRDRKIFDEDDEDIVDEITGSDVFNGDCVKVIKEIADNHGRVVDAIITDPPYGVDYVPGHRDTTGEDWSIEGDATIGGAGTLMEKALKLSRLILKKPAPVIVFCNDKNVEIVKEIIEDNYNFHQILIWDKGSVGTGQKDWDGQKAPRWRPQYEMAVYAESGELRFQNPHIHDGSVLEFGRVNMTDYDHPTQKPVDLMRYIIEGVTDEGDVVMDMFAGSGSTLVAAQQSKRGYIGVEKEEKHYNTIMDRLRQSTLV